jgi:biopolymer transport protein ExbD
MRKNSIKYRRAKRPSGPIELDITALLDVFIVLLIFLVFNSHSSGLLTSTATSIELPLSSSKALSGKAVSVQISKSQIWVDEKEVLNTQTMDQDEVFDRDGKKIVPLYNQLVKLKDRAQRSQELSAKAMPFSGEVNLVVDKTLKYNYLKRIMLTCASAGFKNMRFVVASDLK